MIHFMSKQEDWDRPSIELPPGWHALLQQISQETGTKLKYLYTLAIDELLGGIDIARVGAKAWEIQRETGEDLPGVGARHTEETLRKLESHRKRKGPGKKP